MMGKGRSKAFTLVELIAVILILSVLAMIATPMVSNVVAESRKNSFGVTCKQVYSAVEKFANFQSNSSCFVFDFEKDITESQWIEGVQYQPISKLQLTGTLPRKGQAKLCDGVVEVYADDGENTCLVTEEVSNVLSGTLENIDITAPVLESITLTSTTSTVTVVANAKEEDGNIVKYYYSLDGRDYKESELNTYTFSKLKMSTEYKVYVRAENESGLLSERKTATVVTKQMNNPALTQTSQVPDADEGYEYASKRVIKIEYNIENVVEPVYYFKTSATAKVEEGNVVAVCGKTLSDECTENSVTELVADTWYKGKDKEIEVTYEVEGVLYAATGDGTNISGTATYTISNMDATGPSAKISVGSVKTSQATITATCYDVETGITKYEYSKDNGLTWVDKGTTSEYTFTKLTSETAYTFVVRCTNGSGLTAIDKDTSTTAGLENPDINIFDRTSNELISGTNDYKYNYATKVVLQVTYKNTNIVSPEYYFKTTSDNNITVSSGVIVEECGTGTNPGTCSTSSVTVLAKDTWYRTTTLTPNFNITANAVLYAATGDGTNLSKASTWTIDNIDVSKPEASLEITDVKTSETTLKATCKDNQSGIIKYEYSKDNGVTWVDKGTSSTYTFKELKQGTEYEYVVRCTNGTGILSITAKGKSETKVVANPGFELVSQTPSSGYEYYTSRTIKIKYVSTDVVNPIYYLKSSVGATVESGVVKEVCGTGTTPGACSSSSVITLVANTWYKVSSETPNITYTANGTLYAATGDGTNLSGTATYEVSNMDATAPEIQKPTLKDIKTDRTTVIANCSDPESGITKYEFSKDGGLTWVDNKTTSTYTFTKLAAGTNYTYAVRCTNGAKTSASMNEIGSTIIIINPEFENTNNIPNEGYNYFTSRTYKIIYTNTGMVSPVYYFKANVEATVPAGTVSVSCGKGTMPGECTGSSVTTLVAGTWYKTTSTTPSLTFTKNGIIYALISDGLNTSGTSTYSVSEIDTSEPSASLSVGTIRTDRVTLTATCADSESGITKYEFSKDGGSTYVSNGTKNEYSGFTGLEQGKEYTFGVRCTNGSALSSSNTAKATTKTLPTPTFTNTDNTPSSGYSYYTDRTYKVTYANTNVANAKYYFKSTIAATVGSGVVVEACGTGTNPGTCSTSSVTTLVAGTWYRTNSLTPEITVSTQGTNKLFAVVGDGKNFSDPQAEQELENIDSTKPTISLSEATKSTNSLEIPFTAEDKQSGILSSKTTCVYGTSTNSMTSTGKISGTKCLISGLTQGTKYYYKITVTNGTGILSESASGNATLPINESPKFANSANIPSTGYDYYTSRSYVVTYDKTSVTNPEYYFKAKNGATVASGVVTHVCGTGTMPNPYATTKTTCSTSGVTTLVAGTWYKLSTATPTIVATSNGTLYALMADGNNTSGTSTYEVTNVDTTKPVLEDLALSNKNSAGVTITAKCSDSESGVTNYKFYKDGTLMYSTNSSDTAKAYTYTGLKQENSYTLKTECTNGSALVETKQTTYTPEKPPIPSCANYSNTLSSEYSYYQNRIYSITFNDTGITSPIYYFKSTAAATIDNGTIVASCGTSSVPGTCTNSTVTSLTANTWYKATSKTIRLKFVDNSTVYMMTSDGTNNFNSTCAITNLDKTSPSCSVSLGSKTSNSVIATGSASDSESGIVKYEFNIDGGSWTTTSGSKKYEALTAEKHAIGFRCTNGSGLTVTDYEDYTPTLPTKPTFSNTSNTPSSGYSYYTERVYKITYTSTNVTSPEYYFKSSVNVTSSVGVYKCDDTKLSTCGSTTTTEIKANTWYKTSSATPSLTYTANGTIYAATSDGTNLSGTATYSVSNIDTSTPAKPTITASDGVTSGNWHSANATLTFSGASASSGITYYYGTSSSSMNSTGASVSLSTNTAGLTYYVKACNGAGTCGETSSYTVKMDKGPTCTPTVTAGDGVKSGNWHSANTTLSFSGCNYTSGTTYYYGTSTSSMSKTGTSVTISDNTSGTTYYVKACNGLGVCGSNASYIVKLDKGPACIPTITANDNVTSGNWHTANTTLTFSGCNYTSGTTYYYGTSTSSMTSTGTTVSRTSNTSGLTYYVKACNGLGTCGSNASYTIKLDKDTPVAPTITANDGIGSGSWHTANTTLTFSGSSATSGITYKYGTSSTTLNSTGSSVSRTSNTSGLTYYVQACSGAGKCSSNSSYTIKLDKDTPAAPTITATDGIGSGNWHTADVTLNFSGSSATSGITYKYGTSTSSMTAGSSVSRTSNTSGLTYYVQACSGAGKCSSNSSYTIKLDKSTPPNVTITASDGITSGNWHTTSPVKLTISGSSATSGVTYYYGTSTSNMSVGSSISHSAATSGTTYYAKACSGVGACSSTTSYVVKLSTSGPTVTATSACTSTITMSDPLGLAGYAVTSTSSTPSSWTSVSGTSATKYSTPSSSGRYYVHVKNIAGRTSYAYFDVSSSCFSYAATPYCTGGRTYNSSTGNCEMYYSNNASMCGCKTAASCACGVASYNSCEHSSCGYDTCRTSACGCETYNSCQDSSFGCETWKSCPDDDCTCATYKSCVNTGCAYAYCTTGCATYKSCEHSSCGAASCENSSCSCKTYAECVLYWADGVCEYQDASGNWEELGTCYTGSDFATRSEARSDCESTCSSYCSHSYTCSTDNWETTSSLCGCKTYNSCTSATYCGYKSCANSACGCASYYYEQHSSCGYQSCRKPVCGCETYSSCRTADCGCETYNTKAESPCTCKTYNSCQNSACGYASCEHSSCGVKEYYTCQSESICGCATGNSCTLVENGYLAYSCPNGGTLSGTTCKF